MRVVALLLMTTTTAIVDEQKKFRFKAKVVLQLLQDTVFRLLLGKAVQGLVLLWCLL